MNRIVLIGNGFDLAHGMPTSYRDFILFYLNKCLNEANSKMEYNDSLVLVLKAPYTEVDLVDEKLILHNLSNPTNKKFKGYELNENRELKEMVLMQHTKESPYNKFQFIICFKSELLNQIVSSISEKNWVDVEAEYYKVLKKVSVRNDDSIYQLNQTFQALINELISYLKQVKQGDKIFGIDSYITGKIQQFESKEGSKEFSLDEYAAEILLLNFNYTANADKYYDYYDSRSRKEQIQIHGSIENEINPIIFGYGDEMDEDYKNLELHANKECLKFIKSFGYAKTTNYQKMIRFIESDEFEIYIMGHSCGLSDRVMLNTLFEHENCKLIRIFYHQRKDGTNDFMDIYQNIARQFSLHKRSEFRKKVLSFEVSKELPQSITY